jgi:hypothetical protein
VKKILMPLAVAGALLLTAGCGGSDDTSSGSSPTTPVTLTQADFAPKVQEALKAKGTFRVVTVTTDEGAPATFTTDVKLSGATADVAGSGEGSAVVRVGGQLYGKGGAISSDPKKPWVTYDPTVDQDPMAAISGMLINMLLVQTMTHEVIGGAPYATGFNSAPGSTPGTTDYMMTIDLPKATAAKALGEYLTAETVAQQKLTELTAKVTIDKDNLPLRLDYQQGTAKVIADFSNYGKPVTIAAPPAAEIA